MAIAFRSTNGIVESDITSATRSPVVTKPTGVQDGDLLLMFAVTNTTADVTGVAGWTKIGAEVDFTPDGSTVDGTTALLYKWASGEGATWTMTNMFAATETADIVVMAYTGANSIHKSAQADTAANVTSVSGPSVTPTLDNCMIVQFVGTDPGTGTYAGTPDSSPTGTQRWDAKNVGANSAEYIFIQEYAQTSAAAIALDVTSLTSDCYGCHQIAIGPPVPVTVAPSVATAAAAVTVATGTISELLYSPGIAAATASVLLHEVSTGAGGGAVTLNPTPATASAGVLVPTVSAKVEVAPSIAAATGAALVPTTSAKVGLAPSVATAAGATLVPTVSAQVGLAPTVATATGTVRVPTVSAQVELKLETGPSIAAATGAVLVPTVSAKVGLAPSIATATGAALVPTISANVGIAPTVATAAGTTLVPTTAAKVELAPSIATASGVTLVPAVSAKVGLAPSVATAAGSALVPTVSAQVSLAPTIATATAAIPAPSTSISVSLAPAVAAATGAVLAPSVAAAVGVAPTVATASGSVLLHNATAGGAVNLDPSIAAATAAVLIPAVSAKVGLTPSIATASAAVLVPTVASGVGVAPSVATAAGVALTPTLSAKVGLTPSVATAFGMVGGHGYRERVLADGAIGYWRLGEASGTTAYDSALVPHDGTYQGTFALGVSGPLGDSTAVLFTKASASKMVTPPASVSSIDGTSAVTVECWIKTAETTWNYNWPLTIGRNTGTFPSVPRYIVARTGSTQNLSGNLLIDGAGKVCTVVGVVPNDEWFHFVMTYDGSWLKLYKNGVLIGTPTAASGVLGGFTDGLTIGSADGTLPSGGFNGSVAEVAIYPTALSPTQIAEHYALQGVATVSAQVSIVATLASATAAVLDATTSATVSLSPSVATATAEVLAHTAVASGGAISLSGWIACTAVMTGRLWVGAVNDQRLKLTRILMSL